MSTIQEFENAPVGATATSPDGRKVYRREAETPVGADWVLGEGDGRLWADADGLAHHKYTLGPPPAPATAQEALDLAWELGYPVKEGQVIPEGTKWMKRAAGNVHEYTMSRGHTVTANDTYVLRTHEPLPDPEPDWLDAPAVKARVKGYPVLFTWIPVDGTRHHRWYSPVKGEGETFNWQDLTDVTPLYPKEDA